MVDVGEVFGWGVGVGSGGMERRVCVGSEGISRCVGVGVGCGGVARWVGVGVGGGWVWVLEAWQSW